MRIFARKHPYSRLRIDSRMDVAEKPEYPKISGGLQLMIALEAIPYFTTVLITSVLVSYVLDHPELEWSDVFAWRCASFAGFTFMILSMANYGDRVMNGRFYLFLMFSIFSGICMVFMFFAEKDVALLVFACCIQPLLIVRDASRLCYIVQILRATEKSSKIRTLCFFLFLMANLGAFFKSASFSHSTPDPAIKIWVCIGSLVVYTLLSSLVFIFGSNVVAHRNIVERGFRCVVWKFENVLRTIMRKLCKICSRKGLQDKDYRSLVDEEIVTCVDCMLKMSATLLPLLLYFATAEMTFFIWVRDYDIYVDLGFQDWPISLVDIYHGFNVVGILTIYVIIIPIVQCFVNVPDVVIICLSYFTLFLSWVTTASMQYGNELRETHYAIANESKVIVFTSALNPVLLDVYWSDKRWLNSGNFSVNYYRLNTTNTTTGDSINDLSKAKVWEDKGWLPSAPNPFPKKDIQLASNPSFLTTLNKTECYLLVEDADSIQKKPLRALDRLFEGRAGRRDKLNGSLVTLCSSNLYASNIQHYLVIQDLRTRKFQREQVCDSRNYETLTNLTVGWYVLYLQENDKFVQFQMQVNVRKGAVHYLYIHQGNDTFAPYTGNFTNIAEPFFQIEKTYILVQIGLFSFAYSMGMVALHSFVVGATPKHLLEFGFAIMYTSRALGSGLAAIFLPFVTPGSQGMFTWVITLVAGILLMVRNSWVYSSTGGQCGPEVKFTKAESEESFESEEEDESEEDIETSKSPDAVKPQPEIEQTQEPTPQQETKTNATSKQQGARRWFSRRSGESPSEKKESPPSNASPQKDRPVKNSAPVAGRRPSVQPEPSEKLETLASWFSKTPQTVPNLAPTLGDQQPGPSSPAEPDYDSSSKSKSKNKK